MCQRDGAGRLRVMETKSQTLIYAEESAMNQVPSRQQNRHSTRFIAVLAISAAALLAGTAGYASVKADVAKTAVAGSATSSVYKVNGLEGPLMTLSGRALPGIDATDEIHRQDHKLLDLSDDF